MTRKNLRRIQLAPTAKEEVDRITAKLGIQLQSLSKAIAPNRTGHYLSGSLNAGALPGEYVSKLIELGADPDKMIAIPDPEPEYTEEPEPVSEPATAAASVASCEEIRMAVCNGVVAAWLIIQKQEQDAQQARMDAMFEKVVAELSVGELHDRVQYMLFSAIDGALAKRGQSHLNDGLVHGLRNLINE